MQEIYRMSDLTKNLHVSRSTILRAIARGDFPAPVQLSQRCVGWRVSDVEAWINERPSK